MTDHTRRIALVEPYLGGSHRAWAEGYRHHSVHDVELFALPAIHWKWRMHGAHVTLAPQIAAAVDARGPFDAVMASSMTDVAGLLGIARAALASARVVLFMHENQLTFPRPEHDRDDLTYAMTNWTSMLASDLVVFNSAYHRDDWFAAVRGFLARFPDHRHTSLVDAVAERSVVLPVGADLAALDAVERRAGARPLLLWNQRWEYDKGPLEFTVAIERLVAAGAEFDVALAGDRPEHDRPELRRLRSVLGDRLVHDGHAATDEYRRLLRRADIVVSTAQHEFFGVAITEAVHAGAFPVLPNRLVYPERIPPHLHRACLYDDESDLVRLVTWALANPGDRERVVAELRPAMARCDWPSVAALYDRAVLP